MRTLASALLALSTVSLSVWACSGDVTDTTPAAADASTPDGAADTGDESVGPGPDASTQTRCMLNNGSDPVALCTQKFALKNERQAAFIKALGIASSWDSKTFLVDKDDAGTTLHDVRDDVAFSSSIVAYVASAILYGDNEINDDLNNVLVVMATNIEAELATAPTGYDGQLYMRLRAMAAGLRVINETMHADRIDAIAEAYGRTIAATFSTISAGDGVLGTPAGGGAVSYVTADVAMGALALLDMALRHASDDASADPATWVTAARESLDHLWNRARDPVSGLYYRALTTSADPDHDALASFDALPNDALVTDVQATTMLAAMRANAMLLANPNAPPFAPLATYPFTGHVDTVFHAMNTLGLWDSSPKGAGYFEAYFPSTTTFFTNKPTRANAFMFAVVHRKLVDAPPIDAGATSPEVVQVNALRTLMTQRAPLASSLFSVIDPQTSYLRAASKDYLLARSPIIDPDAGITDAGIETRAASYTAAANAETVEALNEQLYGLPQH